MRSAISWARLSKAALPSLPASDGAASPLAGGLTRSHRVARIVYGLTAWICQLDRAVPEEWRIDYATGTYFLGRKRVPDDRSADAPRFDAVDYYRGAQAS